MNGELLFSVAFLACALWLIGHDLLDTFFKRKGELIKEIMQHEEGKIDA